MTKRICDQNIPDESGNICSSIKIESIKRRAAMWQGEKQERRGEKTSGCPRQLIDLTAPVDLNLNRDPRYKRESPSHFRQHLISILIKSCSARSRSDLSPKELQNKTTKPN